jgi:hypothetical protein
LSLLIAAKKSRIFFHFFLAPYYQRHFQDLVREIIAEQYGLSLRNDVPNESGRHQRGWRGLGLREDQLVGLGLEKN